ncbi:MAG: cupredoxin domain-containing protein [Acidobacteria bacterium]|nr:cupredoxin domain-containing protein [Acidobacteriota bacterium]
MKKSKLLLSLAVAFVVATGAGIVPTNVIGAHTRTVKIKVDKNGFSPSSIDVEAGHKLNLIFNRADKNNCGNTVVFRKLNVRKSLPVGRDVIVSFTPRTPGRITFSCGMGLYKGTVIVSEEE